MVKSNRQLLKDCIEFKVRRLIDYHVVPTTIELIDEVIGDWGYFFEHHYYLTSTDFPCLKELSINFVSSKLNNYPNSMAAPVVSAIVEASP